MIGKGNLVVISGFSGSGKGTIIKSLLQSNKEEYVLSVSATSRKPRVGEIEGVHYFFKSKEEFELMIKKNELIEYAEYVGNYYGTPKKYVEEMLTQGKNVILEIEVVGGKAIKKIFPDAVMIFILPPSISILKQRLIDRESESLEVINHRIMQARNEFNFIENYDYIVVNDDLQEAMEKVRLAIRNENSDIVESMRVVNNGFTIESIAKELKEF